MAEEFQAAVCGGTWWMNTTKSMFGGCSSPISNVGSFGWGGGATSTCEESIITSVSHDRRGHNGDVLIGSIPIMDFRLSQVENYNSMVQEEIMNPESAKNWSPEDNISSTTDFLLDPLNSVTSAGNSPEFPPVCSASSILLQSLLEPDHHHHHAQPQPFFNNQSMNYMLDYNESSPPWSKSFISRQQQPAVADASGTGNLHFSNNTQFWNASTASTIVNETKTPSSQPQFLTNFDQEKHNRLTLMNKINSEEVRDARAVTKRGSNTNTEPAFKRARIETPSPLPTFKVRKEKMGDRITALQQLVSPFGKTDTASVLQEAIEYIKFLHDQVSVLSTPYMKQGAPVQNQQIIMDKLNDLDQGSKQDLKSGGLCLVPISSTFPVANETTVDFWTPTFGGTFR